MEKMVVRRGDASGGLWAWEPLAIFASATDARDYAAQTTLRRDAPVLILSWIEDPARPAYLALPDAYVYGERVPYLGEALLSGRYIGVQL